MNKQLVKEFKKPGSQYRGAPFWAWNGKLEPEELRRQIRIMHRMGLGGFFMHSRVGLDTAYLSKDWFTCVDACIDEAEKLDMQAWLYDEDRWPSGAAGGLVTKNPKYRSRSLVMDTVCSPKTFKWSPESIAAFTARISGSVATEVKQLAKGRKPARLPNGSVILHFRVEIDKCTSWYNGFTYLDTMNHEAVKEFIRVTHEAYRKNISKHFGKRVPGIFTDEPNHADFIDFGSGRRSKPYAPWTARLPKVFEKRYGYDIIPNLVKVFYDVDGQEITPARLHYHDCTTFLFVDAFARQIGEWCDRNNIQHTGHVLAEETLSSQSCQVGSALRFYEHMQAPGMDILTEYRREYETAKGVSSVARQFDRKWRLTETYGCTGWDFPFMGHKAIGDWQAAMGINLRCQHLSWYTMEGQAKRDYPAGIFYQNPWWETYSKVEDYFGRINLVMTQGKEVRDLLVIFPVESTWVSVKLASGPNPELTKLDTRLIALRDSLLMAGIDFDYGDEDIMARHGRVSRSKSGEAVLHVAKAQYRAVVVPPMKTMRASTLALLRKFQKAGGTVAFAGKAPGYVDALVSTAATAFARYCVMAPAKGPGLAKAVESASRRISITDGKKRPIAPALHLLREDKDNYYLFVCNTGVGKNGRKREDWHITPSLMCHTMVRDRIHAFPDVRITGFADCKGQPIEMNPDTGEIFSVKTRKIGREIEITTSLPALGSRLFIVPKNKSAAKTIIRKTPEPVRQSVLNPKTWEITLSDDNSLVLDRPGYRIGQNGWQKPDDILKVDFAVRDALGIQRRGGQMTQPWARTKPKLLKRTPVALAYDFDVTTIPSGALHLALEWPDTFEIKVNGHALSMDAECGWWCDKSCRKIPVDTGMLRPGGNRIELTCDYAEDHPGLEIVYLLGAFGTRTRGSRVEICDAPRTLKVGDWVKQGLSFYSGSVTYRKTLHPKLRKGERLFVQVPEYRGAGVRVLVNGQCAGTIAWEPNEVDITELVKNQAVELGIEILGHRRNSHGPLHYFEKWPYWTGPDQFVSRDKKWTDDYQLVPCGLMKAPKLAVKK